MIVLLKEGHSLDAGLPESPLVQGVLFYYLFLCLESWKHRLKQIYPSGLETE